MLHSHVTAGTAGKTCIYIHVCFLVIRLECDFAITYVIEDEREQRPDILTQPVLMRFLPCYDTIIICYDMIML